MYLILGNWQTFAKSRVYIKLRADNIGSGAESKLLHARLNSIEVHLLNTKLVCNTCD